LWELDSDDKAFYTQLLKSRSPEFFRTSLCHIMGQLTMKVLGFEAGEAFPPVQVICTLPHALVRWVSQFFATPPMSLKDGVHAQL
jgi:hypothetical protein